MVDNIPTSCIVLIEVATLGWVEILTDSEGLADIFLNGVLTKNG